MRNALAVVGAVDIHLAAAIGTIKQACEGSCFAPAVRVASDIPTDFLHKVKGLLVNNGFVRILKNRPFVLRDIMAFLVLEVLSGLEIDGVSQIFTLFKKVADGGRTPAVHIFESLILVHALAVLGKVSGRNEDFFFFQLAGDLIRTVALNRHGKDALDHICGFGVNQPLVSGFVPEIAVNDRACEVLAGLAFGLESGTDFTAGVSGVILVHNVAERGKIIVPSGTVHAVIDGDKANATLTQDFHNLTDFQIVTTHAAHVLDTQVLHIPGFNLFHHCQKSGAVKAGAANAIVREMDNVCKALPCGELLQHCFLIGYGVALTLLVIIFAKVITAQSFVQSSDFLVFSHNLRSFLRF